MLPLARIKKIMKLDDEVKMISADTPMLFSKAAELFILELTLRSWMHTETGNRRTLQRADVANAICDSQVFDFLLDVVPREEDEEDEAPAANEGQAMPQNLTFFPTLGAQLVQQQLNSVNQVTDRNGVQTAPNELNITVPTPNQFPLTPNPTEELVVGNVGGESSRRSPGMYFPLIDDDRYHFNYNPVTDEEMAARPSVEIQSLRPSGGYLGMLGLNNFNFPQNFHP